MFELRERIEEVHAMGEATDLMEELKRTTKLICDDIEVIVCQYVYYWLHYAGSTYKLALLCVTGTLSE